MFCHKPQAKIQICYMVKLIPWNLLIWVTFTNLLLHFKRHKICILGNRLYSLLSFGGPQLYNLEALPFTYDQYVVIKLADKLYTSATVFFVLRRTYVFHIGCKRVQTQTRGAVHFSTLIDFRSNRCVISTKLIKFSITKFETPQPILHIASGV